MKVVYVEEDCGDGFLVCPFPHEDSSVLLENVIYTAGDEFMGFDCQKHGIMLVCSSEKGLCPKRICKTTALKRCGISVMETQEGCSSGKRQVEGGKYHEFSLLRFKAFGNSDEWGKGDGYGGIEWEKCDVLNTEELPRDFKTDINYGGVYLFFQYECTECKKDGESFLANM